MESVVIVYRARYVLLACLCLCPSGQWASAQALPETTASMGPAEQEASQIAVTDQDTPALLVSCQEPAAEAVAEALNTGFCPASLSSSPRWWVHGEYLMWWTRGNELPPLVTASEPTTNREEAGVLGLSSTSILSGRELIDHGLRSGLRISGGHWFDEPHTSGLEVVYFSAFDDNRSGDFLAMTDPSQPFGTGLPILARPFYNVRKGQEDAELVSFPNLLDGLVEVTSSSEVHSVSALYRHLVRRHPRGRLDVIGGYRFFHFGEALQVREQLVATADSGFVAQGTTFDIRDRFATQNNFHGGEIGLVLETTHGVWTGEFLAKVALGRIARRMEIFGSEVRALEDDQLTHEGGLLALPTNIGRYRTSDFATLPELGFNLALAVTDHFKINVGYSLVVLTGVARSGSQIDRKINPSQLSGGNLIGDPRPQPVLADEAGFWMQGINLGLSFER